MKKLLLAVSSLLLISVSMAQDDIFSGTQGFVSDNIFYFIMIFISAMVFVIVYKSTAEYREEIAAPLGLIAAAAVLIALFVYREGIAQFFTTSQGNLDMVGMALILFAGLAALAIAVYTMGGLDEIRSKGWILLIIAGLMLIVLGSALLPFITVIGFILLIIGIIWGLLSFMLGDSIGMGSVGAGPVSVGTGQVPPLPQQPYQQIPPSSQIPPIQQQPIRRPSPGAGILGAAQQPATQPQRRRLPVGPGAMLGAQPQLTPTAVRGGFVAGVPKDYLKKMFSQIESALRKEMKRQLHALKTEIYSTKSKKVDAGPLMSERENDFKKRIFEHIMPSLAEKFIKYYKIKMLRNRLKKKGATADQIKAFERKARRMYNTKVYVKYGDDLLKTQKGKKIYTAVIKEFKEKAEKIPKKRYSR